MLQAFIDDSGWDGQSPVFVLAGYVAKTEQWDAFSAEWQKALDHPDPASIKVLKTNQIYRNNVPNTIFHGWTEEQRDDRLKMFIAAINRHAMHGIVSVIPIEPYRRLITGKFKLEQLDQPYFLAFFGIIIQLLRLTERLKLDDKLEFVFDEQSINKPVLEAEFEKCMAVSPPRAKSLCAGMPKFKSDNDALPLQAADLIAWHARRYYFDQYSGRNPQDQPSNVFFAHMFEPKHDIFSLWTEEKITVARDHLLGRRRSPPAKDL
ncbi:DUF3800 domain-containing protein [Bradyrhizobium sp. AUGA SZCCT0431]|uniref:DUF3800 domain-containing protein n=1 Tax=Bradyrhizobium sp. AUGA SZCCT0431 TaxID=2807674 RepID=UPI001BA7344C|nr:DUF3800 domain-containing protein [Bradyrhizobium sp. AUGA SZCCT0431]MBR1142234.1 DUF3800 domain-containing protein [Bradyrhizobium sp. AUGA SZCCT0431]